jgi:hypothetical protein
MNRKLIKAAIAALVITPCVTLSNDNATSPTPASDAAAGNTGTVVFFREKKMMGAAISYKVRENGVELCKLSSGSFCTLQVPAGKHAYVTKTEATDTLNMEVEPGETYYVQASISMGVVAGHSNLAPSTKDVFDGMKAKLKDNTGKDLDPPKDKK